MLNQNIGEIQKYAQASAQAAGNKEATPTVDVIVGEIEAEIQRIASLHDSLASAVGWIGGGNVLGMEGQISELGNPKAPTLVTRLSDVTSRLRGERVAMEAQVSRLSDVLGVYDAESAS